MNRYTRVENVSFGSAELPLVLSVKLTRHCQPLPAGSDDEFFATSVQLGRPLISAEVRLRDTAAAEALPLGQIGTLAFRVGGASHGQAGRSIELQGAVLHSMELTYEQAAMACAVLRFVAAAPQGNQDPLVAEDSQ
jgi:hypothetical protein